ncbi:Acyl-CoA N-acyltransferase [Penicillium sp. IBT 31633x]|nr:Acyl-CoA N-acyltransferase [Penicillium sp. IBT 31633x]
MGSEICIYEHDAATIMEALVPELPYSTSLLRRIQHGLAYPSKTARILATFPPGLTTPDLPQPWLAARVDLFRGRETQIVLYSSLEAKYTSGKAIDTVGDRFVAEKVTPEILKVDSTGSNDSNGHIKKITNSTVFTISAGQPALDLARAQLLAFLSYVKTNLLPPYLSFLAESAEATPVVAENISGSKTSTSKSTTERAIPLIPAPDPQAFLIGSFHTGLLSLLQRSGSYTGSDPIPKIRVHRLDDPPYFKYFFRRSVFSPEDKPGNSADQPPVDLSLPSGYRFHDRDGREGVLSKHLGLVQSRTNIPRSKTQLSTMPGMAVYLDSDAGDANADEMPIAWGFLGVDGALATLHVEPEHRGARACASVIEGSHASWNGSRRGFRGW